MSFHWCLVMMALDGVIYLVIGWYIRNVKPGDYPIKIRLFFTFSRKSTEIVLCAQHLKTEKYLTEDSSLEQLIVEEDQLPQIDFCMEFQGNMECQSHGISPCLPTTGDV